jgi:manganese oxidase
MGQSRRTSLAAMVVIAALLAGCGGGDDKSSSTTPASSPATTTPGGGGAARSVSLSEFKFAPDKVSAVRGTTLTVTNSGTIQHDLKLRQDSKVIGGTALVAPGKSTSLKVSVPPGSYVMFCSVPGHEQSGMKGTFTVS